MDEPRTNISEDLRKILDEKIYDKYRLLSLLVHFQFSTIHHGNLRLKNFKRET